MDETSRRIHNGLGRMLAQLVWETVMTVIPALVLALLINVFMAQATVVQGQSMEPTLHTAERLVVEKLTYRLLREPRRGDVVVLRTARAGQEMLIKRVVGLPGETVESHGGQLMINGQPLAEEWATLPGGMDIPPTTVPPLHVFVLGDNRGASNDSRAFGPVPVADIVGRAFFSYWPPAHIGPIR